MASSLCNIVYVDKRALRDRLQTHSGRDETGLLTFAAESSSVIDAEAKEVQVNLQTLLSMVSEGASCMAKVQELNASITSDCKPILVILDLTTDPDGEGRRVHRERSTPSPKSSGPGQELSAAADPDLDLEDLYSFRLLQRITNEISYANYSKLIVPIALVHEGEEVVVESQPQSTGHVPLSPSESSSHLGQDLPSEQNDHDRHGPSAPVSLTRMMKCLEAGAVDVLTSPLHPKCVYGLTAHAHRAHKESVKDQAAFLATMRLKKQSWVGMDREAPYAYLRESMVSHLMTSICKPESILQSYNSRSLYIVNHRQDATIATAIGRWDFSAHDFSEDELVHAAFLMLQHALEMPALEKWRIPTDKLKDFLMACRAAYNGFVLYHNFRHVVDVLQAVFYFLLQLRILPPYPATSQGPDTDQPVSPIAALLKPFDALTLLVSAIGHDVGHPGVNNAFLVALKAPLAQLYNDNSVLEAFHCAAYSQILRRYWNVTFEDTELRKLLIKSILATDMGVHFKYMADLGNLQEKLHHNKGTDGWSPQVLDEYKTLACGLLIKCADISNVARPFDVAAKWSDILQLEFARQGEMEKDVGIPTTLFGGPPELGNMTKLAHSQIGFMNIFAYPLFEAVTDILPGMHFAVSEIKKNQGIWKERIDEDKVNEQHQFEATKYSNDGFQSPRSGSPDRMFAASPEFSHPEGLPASGSSPSLPSEVPMSTSQSLPDISAPLSPLPGLTTAGRSAVYSHDPVSRSLPHHRSIIQSGPVVDPIAHSRRSSEAYPAANILNPGISSSRRSSNTVPTQLQLGLPSMQSHPHPISTENTPPVYQSTGNSSFFAANETKLGSFSADSNHRGSTSTSAGGGGPSNHHHGSKSSDGESSAVTASRPGGQPYSYTHGGRQSAQQSSGRYSALSSLDRYSNTTHTSGGQTIASHVLPNSPTETQATSFLTDGSDVGNTDDGTSSTPETTDMDRLGDGDRGSTGLDGTHDSNEVVFTTPRMNGHSSIGGERVVRKKNSRFRFDFWKKKSREGNVGSPSP